jgi:multiple sugar transport system permease protein
MSASEGRIQRPRRGMTRRRRLVSVVVFVSLLVICVLWSLPLLLMLSTSLKSQAQLYQPTRIIPDPLVWSNYPRAIFEFLPFVTFFQNSLIIAVLAVIGDVLSSAFIAYGFARLRFPGRSILFMLMLSTMMFPFAVRMIPLFLIFRELGWINTFLPLIVPSYFGTHALFIFLLYQFFRGIPAQVTEVARVDGANELQIWWHIVLPLSRPALAVVAILAFQQSWNDFLAPLVFLTDQRNFTVTLGLYSLIGGQDAAQRWQFLMAATVVSITPVVLLFFFAQRYFIRGITISGLKG